MGKQYKELTEGDIEFINQQKLFFIASSSSHEVNLSPRGYDSIWIKNCSTLYMLDLPGSGNRTARDSKANGNFTLLFTAFEGDPHLVRLFCKAKVIAKHEADFNALFEHFDSARSIVRQIFEFTILQVESSCGMSVPIMKYEEDRNALKEWAVDMAEGGDLKRYMQEHEIPPSF